MLHTLGSLFLLFVLLCSLSCAQEDRPTTPFFPEVFLGKCYLQNPSGVDCYSLLNNFSVAASTDNYHQNDALYNGFFSLANFSTPKSSIMFWSGSKDFALAVSGNDNRFVTVEETSTGFIINSLSWCGTPDNTFNYATPCPYNGNTTSGYYGTDGVWKRASKAFAEGAEGIIYVLLQPPQYGAPIAYRPWSIFGSIEFPALNVSKIEKIVVLLLVNSTSAPEEKCGSGSLVELNQLIIDKFGFEMDCMDNPKDIYSLFCPLGTSSGQCLAATLVYNYESAVNPPEDKDHFIWAIITTVLAGVFFIISLLLLLRVATLRKRSDEK